MQEKPSNELLIDDLASKHYLRSLQTKKAQSLWIRSRMNWIRVLGFFTYIKKWNIKEKVDAVWTDVRY